MAESSQNPLVSNARASDNAPTVQLHPLVLLTISDCITRHTLRQNTGPVVGAIIGQQNGQEITMEVAFQAKLLTNNDGDVVLDEEWFNKRIEDFKDVHKSPPLDIVGWFTLGPRSGPQPHILPIHNHISQVYTEAPLLVLFHPEDAFSEATAAGKLPLTLYEPLSENVASDPNDKAMDIDGAVQAKSTKFKELVYTIETGEAEMISVDFVARGGGNATAVEGSPATAAKPEASKIDEVLSSGKRNTRGKQKENEKEKEKDAPIDESTVMTAEDDELLTSLTAKMNAIRMLSRRVQLLRTYLDTLPPSYLTDPSLPLNPAPDAQTQLPLNHTVLRSISATLARINILAPPDSEAFTLESQQEASDVQLVSLLASITNSISAAKEFGRKSHIVEHGKNQQKNRMGGMGMGMMGGYGGDSGRGEFLGTVLGGGSGGDRWSSIVADQAFLGHDIVLFPIDEPTAEDLDNAGMIGPYAFKVLMAISVCITPPLFMFLIATSHILIPLFFASGIFRVLRWMYRTLRDRPGRLRDALRWVLRKFDELRRWWTG